MAYGSGGSGGYGGGSVKKKKAEESNLFTKIAGVIPDVVEKPVTGAVGGTVGFAGNLLGDVKDAVVGLPMGFVQLARDPVGSVKAIGGTAWQTWSPLFEGDFVKFAKQTYDHPLAPILDIATVFTAGAGTAARGASALSKAGSTSATVKKVAGLRETKTVKITDPTGKDAFEYERNLSPVAGRRVIQEAMWALDRKGALPSWYTRGRYQRAKLTDMAHRHVAMGAVHGEALRRNMEIDRALADDRIAEYASTRLGMEAMIQGGKALVDNTELGQRARSTVVASMHGNLARHAKRVTLETAAKLVGGKNSHWRYVVAPEHADKRYANLLDKRLRAHSAATRRRSDEILRLDPRIAKAEADVKDYEARASNLKETERQIERLNEQLNEMRRNGWDVTDPARTIKGNLPIGKPRPQQRMRAESKQPHEVQERLKELYAKREEALKWQKEVEPAKVKLERLREQRKQLDAQVEERWRLLEETKNRSAEDYYKWAGETSDGFRNVVNHFGRNFVGKDVNRAMHGGDGTVLIVPKHDAYQLGLEAGNSVRFLHKLIHKPTQFWKSAVIGYTPRTVTNNGIGNWAMFAAREGTSGTGLLALRDALSYHFGAKAVDEPLFAKNHWIDRYFQDELADQFGVGNEIVQLGEEALTRKAKGKRLLRQGFYPLVHKTSERPLRTATIYAALRRMPEVRAAIKDVRKSGVRGQRAVDTAIERVLKERPDLRDAAALRSRQLAGDYVTLSETEKWLRDIIPFYLWSRHIVKTTGNMALEQPGHLAVGARISALGIAETEEMLGEIPDFLRGAIPLAALGFGDGTPSRAGVLLTASLNPWATVGEIAESVQAFATGDVRRGAFFSQWNPFFTGAVESATQTSLLTGAPSPRSGGVVPDVLSRTTLALPHLKLADELLTEDTTKTAAGNERLFARDDRSALTSILGIPLRSVGQEAAQRQSRLEKGEDEKPKKKTIGYGGG